MKNSAWYQKLWRKKLDELPVQQDTESSWPDMKKLLDEHMPEMDTDGGRNSNSFGNSLVSLLGYLIPIAVIIGAIGYFYSPRYIKPKNVQKQKTKQQEVLDSLKHEQIKIDHIGNDNTGTKALPVNGNTFVQNGNPTVYPVKENNILSKEETAASNSGTRIKILKYNRRGFSVGSPKKTAFVFYKRSLLSAGIKKPDDFHNRSIVETGLKDNGNPVLFEGGKQTDSVTKISSESRYLDGKNEAAYSKGTTDQSITQASTSGSAKPDLLKQVPAIITAGKKTGGKPNGLESKNTAKGKKASIFITPRYNYGLEIGVNTAGKVSFYFGAFGSYALNKRLLVNAGVRINSYRQLSGEYSHPSYYRPDSLPPFKVIDSRKLLTFDIPVNLEYRISKTISIKAGPVISLSLKQTGISSKLAPIADHRDTVYHSKEINKAIGSTVISKASFGFMGCVSFHLKKFDLNSNYQLLTPYKVSNDLGSYRKTYHTVQIGIGYRFK